MAFETIVFAASNIGVSVLAVVSTALITNHVTESEFDSYALALSIVTLSAAAFEFGLFSAAARLLAVASSRTDQRELLGATLLSYVPVGLAYSLFVFGLSFFVDDWFKADIGHLLRVSALALVGIPFVFAGQQLAQGVDRLHVSSVASFVGQLLIVGLFAAAVAAHDMSSEAALILRALALLASGVVIAIWLRPGFARCRAWIRLVIREARAWGFQVYVGRLLSMGTYNLDVVMLGIWASVGDLGYYVLAASIAGVAGLPVTGLATALFARMAHRDRIEPIWLILATGIGLALALLAWILAEPFIRIVFSERYVEAAALVLPLALARAIAGVTAIYNVFLGAQGLGRELRNASLVLAGSNVLLNFALIPTFGAMGAALASVGALVANLVAHVVAYHRSQARRSPTAGVQAEME